MYNKEDKEEWVIIDAKGIDILVSKSDPWYQDLHEEWPNERPVSEEDDFEIDPEYDDMNKI